MSENAIRILNKIGTLSFLLVLSSPVLADDSTSASSYRAELISYVLSILHAWGPFMGVLLFISAGLKLKKSADERSQVNKLSIWVTFIAAAIFFNFYLASNVIIGTYRLVDSAAAGVCFVVEDSQISESCYSDEISELTGETLDRVKKLSNEGIAQEFKDNIRLIVGIFQMIGLIYFFVGVNGLVQVSNGSAKDGGYGKPLVTMISSALIMDLPHTATMFMDTINKIGINF